MIPEKLLSLTNEECREMVWGSNSEDESVIFVDDIDCGSGRWQEYRQLIVSFEGKLYATEYTRGLTEVQDEIPFEYSNPNWFEVERKEKVIFEYVRKEQI